jgi:hypothetical protein
LARFADCRNRCECRHRDESMNGTVRRDPDKICDQPASQSTTAPHAVSVTEINKVNTQTGHTQCRALTNSIRQRAENLVEDVHNSLQSRTVGVCVSGGRAKCETEGGGGDGFAIRDTRGCTEEGWYIDAHGLWTTATPQRWECSIGLC